tara:strand:+ start:50 stop:358 length:309 start_codon:yes stop_codon:yes gene_type:complete
MKPNEIKRKEIDQIENLIDEIIANEIRTEKARDKNGLADNKYLKICADFCRKLDKELSIQVTLSKYEVSNIFEPYLNHEKINEETKRMLKKRLENYLTGVSI